MRNHVLAAMASRLRTLAGVRVLSLSLVLLGCGPSGTAPPGESGTTVAATDDDDAQSGATAGTLVSSEAGSGTEAEASSTNPTTAATSDGTGSTSGDPAEGSETAGGAGPVELYRGPVAGGAIPGWDLDEPRPLLLLGREGDEWVTTLARIGPDGSISDNVAEEIIVWGFAVDPPLLYQGPVDGGSIDNWDPADPTPLLMMGRQGVDWVATLATIQPDGAIGDNFAEEILVWGWSGLEPSAPTLRYEGSVAGGTLPGWDSSAPEPLLALGTPGFDLWVTTLVRIAEDGTLSDNVAMTISVWGW